MNDLEQDLSTLRVIAGQVNRFTSRLPDAMMPGILADIRRAQFAAYWSAPFAARDADILAAIYRGWYFLEREQFPGVPLTITASAR